MDNRQDRYECWDCGELVPAYQPCPVCLEAARAGLDPRVVRAQHAAVREAARVVLPGGDDY